MTRTQMLLVFIGAGVFAMVAGVITSIVIADHNGGTSTKVSAVATQPSSVPTFGVQAMTAVHAPPMGTPIPLSSLHPETLMFCEPLQQGGQGASTGASTKIAVVPYGTQVYYKPGTCEPDIDANGMVATASGTGDAREPAKYAGGSIVRVKPQYVPVSGLGTSFTAGNIVWTPAKGDRNGVPTIMTGRYLKHNAKVAFDVLGSALLDFSMTDDGQQIFGSTSRRLIGLPLAMFLDGEPLRGGHGQILAPTINATITDAAQTTGLSLDDAKRLAALIDNGLAK